MSDNKIMPEAQAYSDAIMQARNSAAELKRDILRAEAARVALQTKLMSDPNVKIMAMDSGDIEALAFEIAGCYGKTRQMHKLANDLGRKLNVAMPSAPAYDPEYEALLASSVNVPISAPARR
jgi:hypothetical protein